MPTIYANRSEGAPELGDPVGGPCGFLRPRRSGEPRGGAAAQVRHALSSGSHRVEANLVSGLAQVCKVGQSPIAYCHSVDADVHHAWSVIRHRYTTCLGLFEVRVTTDGTADSRIVIRMGLESHRRRAAAAAATCPAPSAVQGHAALGIQRRPQQSPLQGSHLLCRSVIGSRPTTRSSSPNVIPVTGTSTRISIDADWLNKSSAQNRGHMQERMCHSN